MHAPLRSSRLRERTYLPAILGLALIGSFTATPAKQADDHADLIQQAKQAYASDTGSQPIVSDPLVTGYVDKLANRLIPEGKPLPAGARMQVTVVESSDPTLYSFADGHIVVSTGALFSVANEAQLAGVLAHEVAHVVEGHNLTLYKEVKAAERRQRRKGTAGALFGGLLDVAVGYAVNMEAIELHERVMQGELTYVQTLERLAALGTAEDAYYTMRDVVGSIPEKDDAGQWIDPRQQFEVVAAAQAMEYVALAGYDIEQAVTGWERLREQHSRLAREETAAWGAWAEQVRASRRMAADMERMHLTRTLGTSGLVRTPRVSPVAQAELCREFTRLEEVRVAQADRVGEKGVSDYRDFLRRALLPRADRAFAEENYAKAREDYRNLYDKGIRTAASCHGLARSELGGDFAFGASNAKKEQAERLYKEAAQLDASYAPAHRSLAELYEDWDRYVDAVASYREYLRLAPDASDRGRIERRISVLERKAKR